jgi:hypothetical protein
MQIGIIIALIAIVGFAGYTMKIQAAAHRAGIEECQAKVTAANAELTRQAGELKQEAENHITDMVAAYDAGESQAKTRTVYLQSKGRADVDQHPDVYNNRACTLPASSLRIVNASRAGLRRDPAADGLRDDADSGPGAGARPAANPAAPDGGVRGAGTAQEGHARGDVLGNAGGRRPLGKVR